MAYTLTTGWNDTAISGVTTLSLTLPVINFPVDWRVRNQGSRDSSQTSLVNLTSAIDRTERFDFKYAGITDVYSNSGIDRAFFLPSHRGVSIYEKLYDTWMIKDESDSAAKVYYVPVEGSISLRFPAHELITADLVKDFLCRLVDGMFESGTVTSERLSMLMRGSTSPLSPVS